MRLAAALVALCVAARLLSWDPIAHGDRARHVKVTLLGGTAAAVVALGARTHAGAGTRWPLLWAGAVLLAADVTHYARVVHPIARGAPIQAVGGAFDSLAAARRMWDLETTGSGTIEVDGERSTLLLSSPPGSTAFLSVRLGSLPDAQRNWLLPVGLLERERREHVTWRASVRRTASFFVVAELRRLLIQSVSYGVHITYPDERDQLRGHEVPHPVGSDGRAHEWVVERTSREVWLSIDGARIWSAAPREPLTQLRVGESKADPQHGGAMTIERAALAVSLDRS